MNESQAWKECVMTQMKDDENRRALILRLRRVEGQVRGVQQLMENEAPCESIAQQLSAARRALDKVFYMMMACMIEQQVTEDPSPKAVHADVKKLTEMLSKYS